MDIGGTTRCRPSPVLTFSMRIVHLDYVMLPPVAGLDVCVSRLEGTVLSRVPVIRVFGATPAGQKTCCHIHKVRVVSNNPIKYRHTASTQVFPYMYVPYPDDLPDDPAGGASLHAPLALASHPPTQHTLSCGAWQPRSILLWPLSLPATNPPPRTLSTHSVPDRLCLAYSSSAPPTSMATMHMSSHSSRSCCTYMIPPTLCPT